MYHNVPTCRSCTLPLEIITRFDITPTKFQEHIKCTYDVVTFTINLKGGSKSFLTKEDDSNEYHYYY